MLPCLPAVLQPDHKTQHLVHAYIWAAYIWADLCDLDLRNGMSHSESIRLTNVLV